MKIHQVTIKNFRTFDSEGISLSFMDLTALVGENSTGKSNVLEALDLFFNYSKTKVSKEIFHHDDITREIEIGVTFNKLSEEEEKRFRIHLDESGKQLSITQIIQLQLEDGQEVEDIVDNDFSFSESKHGTKWIATDEYDWARLDTKLPTKTNVKKWWQEDLTIGDFDFKSLFEDQETIPSQGEYKDKLEILWNTRYENIPKEKVIGDDKVLGWKNILQGNLPKYFYLPAVKHIEEDFKILKTNPFGQMITWLTSNITEDIRKDFEDKTREVIDDAISLIDRDADGNSKIEYLNERLNANLGSGIDCKLELRFGQPSISDIVFPSPQIMADDGYVSEVAQKGHGIQRLTMFSFLRTYNDFKRKRDSEIRNIIIAIEEPEIYLHPPVKRATFKLLRELSNGNDQVVYSTHDDYFLAVEYFDEIRLFRKQLSEMPKTLLFEFSIADLINHYRIRYGIDVDEKSIRDRFGYICDQSKNEGFFSKKVILIEGETEKFSLPIYFKHYGLDVDADRISILSAGSVDSISYLYTIFNEFRIPCYIIYDGDRPEGNPTELTGKHRNDALSKSKRNKELHGLVYEDFEEEADFFFPATKIDENLAVWEKNYEDTFHKSVDIYDEIKAEAKALYNTDSKPLTGKFFANALTTEYPEKISPYMSQLVENIRKCEWKKTCLVIEDD